MTPGDEQWFRYVRIPDVPRFMAMGWHDLGPCPGRHGDWSHLMQAPMCWKFDESR